MKSEIAEMWRLCFGDPDEYINFFLENAFKPEQTLLARDGEKIAAMLTLIPFEAVSENRTFAGRYIFAVATHPDYQKRGISTALLDESHRVMKESGVDFSVLVPASESLFDFYGKRGFETQFYIDRKKVSTDNSESVTAIRPSVSSLLSMSQQRDFHFGKSSLFCRWGTDFLAVLDKECAFQGGSVLSFKYNASVGYCVCYPYRDTVIVKECAPPDAAEYVASSLAKYYDKKSCEFRLPSDIANGKAFAMTYWYSAKMNFTGEKPPYLSLVLD